MKTNKASQHGVHHAALMRCTARLMMTELISEPSSSTEILIDLSHLFEQVAKRVNEQSAGITSELQGFDYQEVQWFMQNSYSVISNHLMQAHFQISLSYLNSCSSLIRTLRMSDQKPSNKDLDVRAVACFSLAAQLALKDAREVDCETSRSVQYRLAREYITKFHTAFADLNTASQDKDFRTSARKVRSIVISGDFEAAIYLEEWQELHHIIQLCQEIGDNALLQQLADMTLASEATPEIMLSTLQHILASASHDTPTAMIARWIRILYHVSLSATNNPQQDVSEATETDILIQRAITLCDRNRISNDPKDVYPDEELEWLSTTTFNRGVDAHCAAQPNLCRKLIEQAIDIAARLGDGGVLKRLLLQRSGVLRLEG